MNSQTNIPQKTYHNPAIANRASNIKWAIHGNLLKIVGIHEGFVLNEVLNLLQIATDIDSYLEGDPAAGWVICGYAHFYEKYSLKTTQCTRAFHNLLTPEAHEKSKTAHFRNGIAPKPEALYKDAPPKCLGYLEMRDTTKRGTEYRLDLQKLLSTLNSEGLRLGAFVVSAEGSKHKDKRLSHDELCATFHLYTTPVPEVTPEAMQSNANQTKTPEDIAFEQQFKPDPPTQQKTDAELPPTAAPEPKAEDGLKSVRYVSNGTGEDIMHVFFAAYKRLNIETTIWCEAKRVATHEDPVKWTADDKVAVCTKGKGQLGAYLWLEYDAKRLTQDDLKELYTKCGEVFRLPAFDIGKPKRMCNYIALCTLKSCSEENGFDEITPMQ